MLFKTDLLIPIGKTKTAPATIEMKLCMGTITRSFTQFPAGCAGLVWVQIWLSGHQLIPWERGQWLRGDDHIIWDYSRYPVGGEPRLLVVKGYNEDTANPHTIQVGIEVSAPVALESLPPAEVLLQELGVLW